MSMDLVSLEATSVGATRPPPESGEAAGGKRLKSEPDWESMRLPWEYKSIEDVEESDMSMFYDYPQPLYIRSTRLVFKNKAMIEYEKAVAEFRERSPKLSAYDAVAPPANLGFCGGVRPFPITDDVRPRLIHLCNLALEEYNAQNQGANFVFHDLVKSTSAVVAGRLYYITFQAKDVTHPSNSATRTFQAEVCQLLPKGTKPVVNSCFMKPA